MARDFSGTSQYLTFADVAGHDWSAPWTVAAIVYTDSIAAGDRTIVSHCDAAGAPSCGWSFSLTTANIIFEARAQWGIEGTATTALTTGAWYGVACTKAAASTQVIYYRYLLSTSTFASETVETFANGYNDGTSPGRIGAVNTGAGPALFWDGRIARVAFWGQVLTQAELEQVFRGTSTFPTNLKAWWELSGTADPEIDHGSDAAHAANVSTTFIDNPTDIGNPFGAIAPVIAMQRQGGQMIGRRYV